MQTLIFKVTKSGSPVQGAIWTLGSLINKKLTTDANGEATVQVEQLMIARVVGEVRIDNGNGNSVALDIDASVDAGFTWGGGLTFTRVSAANDLPHAQAVKNARIDAKTQELIDAGFTYDSQTFSLSREAQANWIGGEVAKASLTFPMTISTKADGTYSIPDAATYSAMYLTAVGTKDAHLGSGRTLKASVNACTTVAEVNAVEDNRC